MRKMKIEVLYIYIESRDRENDKKVGICKGLKMRNE